MIKYAFQLLMAGLVSTTSIAHAQNLKSVINRINIEATDNSHLERLAHELTDVIGPRLGGTPQMKKAHIWAVETFNDWRIEAESQPFGEWRGWKRGITNVDLIDPRVVSLEAMQLAWSPPTPEDGITAGIVIIPDVEDSSAFAEWLPQAEGKFVLASMKQPTGRPNDNWEEFATEKSFKKMKEERRKQNREWLKRIEKTGYNRRTINTALENAGAAGTITSNWSRGFVGE